MTDSRPSPTTPELDQLREFVRVVVAIYLDNCGGVSGLSALGTSACARMSIRPKQATTSNVGRAFLRFVPGP